MALARVVLGTAEARGLADHHLLAARVAEPAEVHDDVPRDRDDAPVLETLPASDAQFLVTGGADLLAPAGRHPILTPRAYHDRFV